MPPWRGVSDMNNWKETPGHSADLEPPHFPHRRPGGGSWGEGELGMSALTSTSTTPNPEEEQKMNKLIDGYQDGSEWLFGCVYKIILHYSEGSKTVFYYPH